MTPLSPSDLEAAEAAHALTEQQLLLDLGRALAGPGPDRDREPGDLIGDAQNWFERNREALKGKLCGQAVLTNAADTATDIAAVADLIAGTYGKPTAFTVAAIVLKRGLRTLCDNG